MGKLCYDFKYYFDFPPTARWNGLVPRVACQKPCSKHLGKLVPFEALNCGKPQHIISSYQAKQWSILPVAGSIPKTRHVTRSLALLLQKMTSRNLLQKSWKIASMILRWRCKIPVAWGSTFDTTKRQGFCNRGNVCPPLCMDNKHDEIFLSSDMHFVFHEHWLTGCGFN